MPCARRLRFWKWTRISSPTSARMIGPRMPSQGGWGFGVVNVASVYSMYRVFFHFVRKGRGMRPPWTRSWPDGAKSQTTSSAAMKYSRIAAGTGGTATTDPKARRIQSASTACFIIDIDLHFQQAAAIALLSDRWDFLRSMGTAARVTPFARTIVRRLLRAISRADAIGVIEAGRLAAAGLRGGGVTVACRAAAVAEAVLFASDDLPDAVRTLLERAVDELVDGSRHGRRAVAARCAQLWTDVAAALATGNRSAPSVEDAIQEYLGARLDGRVRLHELARTLGYSSSHISSVVRRVTGRRFTELRRDMQLGCAMRLLAGGARVKEAAYAAGFRDPAYFIRVFRRAFKTTPGRWRPTRGADSAATRARR